MIRKWLKKLLTQIVREVIEEQERKKAIRIRDAIQEIIDSGECDSMKRD